MRALCLGLLALAGLALWGSVLWRAPVLPFAVSVHLAPPAAPPRALPWRETRALVRSQGGAERLSLALPRPPCPGLGTAVARVVEPFAPVETLALGTPTDFARYGRLCAQAGCTLPLALPCPPDPSPLVVTALGAAFGFGGLLHVDLVTLAPAPAAPHPE